MNKGDDVPAVRVLPMSDREPGFAGKSIEQVQSTFFLRRLPKAGGRWRHRSSGLNAERGTVVIFQFKARAIATAVLRGGEKFERPRGDVCGVLHFDPTTIRTFKPLDAAAMREVWPAFRRFGRAKFMLNPGHYAAFVRQLCDVQAPSGWQG